ncbi:MAG: acid--CoA ligase [Candidatus Aminicenantales bacterium]
MRVVDRIIKPLKLSFIAGRPPLLKAAQQELQMAAEEQEKSF